MRRLLFVLLALTACSHDTERANPVDPLLTAPVDITATLDDTTGYLAVSWSEYDGDRPFDAYLVLRSEADSRTVDTLAVVDGVTATSFVDTNLLPNTAYEYRVAVRNGSGFMQPSSIARVDGFDVATVRLRSVVPDSTAGTIELSWDRYSAPGFEAYEIHRRQIGTDADSVLARIDDRSQTTLVDTTARHDTDYLYHVVVSAAGVAEAGPPSEGRLTLPAVRLDSLHFDSPTASARLTWQPWLNPRFASYQVWRTEAGDRRLVVVLEDPSQTSWTDHDLFGTLTYEYEVQVMTTRDESVRGASRSGSIHTLIAEWPLHLSDVRHVESEFVRLYGGSDQVVVLTSEWGSGTVRRRIDSRTGEAISEDTVVVDFVGTESLEINVRGYAWMDSDNGERLIGVGHGETPAINAVGSVGTTTVLEIDTGQTGRPIVDESVWIVDQSPDFSSYRDLLIESITGDEILRDRRHRIVPINIGAFFDSADSAWGEFRVSVRLQGDHAAGLRIGDPVTGALWVDVSDDGILQARWGQGDAIQTSTASIPFSSHDTPRISIEPIDGGFRITHESTIAWSEGRVSPFEDWATIAPHGGGYVLTVGTRAFHGGDDDSVTLIGELPLVTETRSWRVEGDRIETVGIAMPELNRVAFNPIFRAASWVTLVQTNQVGPDLGNSSAGTLSHPLSIDGSPSGRVYVLDAGNHRIVVLTEDGTYLTEFGTFGSGPGQFDFLDGRKVGLDGSNYAGSVAVDDDGFIYVADVGNNRIQKFAP